MSLTNLQNFALNILKETDHSTAKDINDIEVPLCKDCDKKILVINYEPFTILACGHMYHRYCIEKKILLTDSNVCPISSCNKSVEPAVSVQKEYESSQSSGTSDLVNLLGKSNLGFDSPRNPPDDSMDVNTSREDPSNPTLSKKRVNEPTSSDKSPNKKTKQAKKESHVLKELIKELSSSKNRSRYALRTV